ncbi:Uncharacterised protein [Burkholderia pseudomallei]|nr:Uncharacterised protein [Burkholderia pseudomallei]CAJ5907800.1 Uncharacterised protein [Burkholderia pseudomallei]VBC56814.1 Uncharacterised protein [Burkholderia pseudomallei]VBH18528.1 Uncharacterised protein [Burkholderia pseudomallei]
MAVDPFGALARMKRPMRESPERASSGSLSSFGSFGSPGSFGLSDATEPGPYRREAARTPAPAWWTAYPARKAAADSTGRVLAAFHAAFPCGAGAGVDRVALARSARPAARTACAGGPPPFASPVRTARRSGSGARRRAYFAMKIPDVGQVPCVPASVTSDAALGNCDVASVFTEIHASVK